MIRGLGTDIIEVSRIQEFAGRGEDYLTRVFTEKERALAVKGGGAQFLAGRFAAKEAVAKSLGPPFSWQDVEVISAEDGAPLVLLHGRAKNAARGGRVLLTISHSREYAVAVAVFEVSDSQPEAI